MKLSGKNTKELMARLIRKEFDRLEYLPQYFDDFLNLIKLARSLELYELGADMIVDLSSESGMSADYVVEKLTELERINQ